MPLASVSRRSRHRSSSTALRVRALSGTWTRCIASCGRSARTGSRARVGHRHRGEQRLRVRVQRRRVERVARGDLDDPAEVHHRDAVADMAHDREVVRDEEVRQTQALPAGPYRLTICAWIDTSSADTGSSQTISSGSQRQRARDADALALAARELVRVAARRMSGGRPTVRSSSATRSRARARGTSRARSSGSPTMSRDRHARIERAVRILEDHLHAPPQRPHAFAVERA